MPQSTASNVREWSADAAVSPTDLLVREIAPGALDAAAGGDDYRVALGGLGSLRDSRTQLDAVHLLGRGVLTADIAAVKAVETAITGRTHRDRYRIIATLGELSASAGQSTASALEPLLHSAARECAIAPSLVVAARERIGTRQTNHRFVHWVTNDPDGFSRWVWSLALRSTGGRIWDRCWTQLARNVGNDVWNTLSLVGPQDRRAGWRPFDESADVAREAAISALVDAALSDDASRRSTAWREAMSRAEQAFGALTWARFANDVRAELGQATWAQTTSLIETQVEGVITDLPWIAGFVGLIALALEAAISPIRASVVVTGARAMARFTDIDDALSAAVSETKGTLARIA